MSVASTWTIVPTFARFVIGRYVPYPSTNSWVKHGTGSSFTVSIDCATPIPTRVCAAFRMFFRWPSFGGTSSKKSDSARSICLGSILGAPSRSRLCSSVKQRAFSSTMSAPPASLCRCSGTEPSLPQWPR